MEQNTPLRGWGLRLAGQARADAHA